MKNNIKKRYSDTKNYISSLKNMPLLPDTVIRLRDALSKKFVNSKDVVEIISSNSVVAGELIKKINSGKFIKKPNKEITSIKSLVDYVGVNNPILINMVTAIELKISFSSGNYEKDQVEEIIEYTTDTAYLCAELSDFIHDIKRSEAYLFGMFIECGYILLSARQKHYFKLFFKSKSNPVKSFKEEVEIGADHACAGYILACNWDLPSWIKTGILVHHDDFKNLKINKKIIDMLYIYHVSNYLVGEISFGSYVSSDYRKTYKAFLEELSIDESNINSIRNSFIVDRNNI